MATRYRVYCTPLVARDTYGAEIEVTDYVQNAGIKTIKRSIDAEDYDVGTFTFSDLEIKAQNVNGIFNEETDFRSIFKHSRDRAKFRVVYENDAIGESIVYRGILNEEATKLDVSNDTISFRVLSSDSVLRNTRISGGTISSGITFTTALITIFSDTKIASVLTLNPSNISLQFDTTIDNGAFFDNKSAREALNALLIASGAIILVDKNSNVFIKSRKENLDTPVINLYGPYDIHRRQNTLQLKDYNTGLHRMYTAITVNNTITVNNEYAASYGYRNVTFKLDFITDSDKILTISRLILDEFKAPKIEAMVEAPISVVRNVEILDRVSLNWPLRITPPANKFLPIVGQAKIGDAMTPLPLTLGSLSINPKVAFKVIEIQEDPAKFSAFLKLRQIGNSLGDGYFTDANQAIVGFAVVGTSQIGEGGSPSDTWNPSVVGAALIGSTMTQ